MELIRKYFYEIPEAGLDKLDQFASLLAEWNEKINLVSRQDLERFEEHHLLHSMAIAQWIQFRPGTTVLDLGTGGGLPGIPLAICFPGSSFTLIDARAKKIMVVNEIIAALGLENVRAHHQRAEEVKDRFDFVVSRAVASLDQVWRWARPLIHLNHRNAQPNGLIVFKGGKLGPEIAALPKGTYSEKVEVASYFSEEYFEEKYLVYVQR